MFFLQKKKNFVFFSLLSSGEQGLEFVNTSIKCDTFVTNKHVKINDDIKHICTLGIFKSISRQFNEKKKIFLRDRSIDPWLLNTTRGSA